MRMTRIAAGSASAIMLAAGVCAGALFRHRQPAPQQRLLDALNRGNAAEASQVWLTMTPEARNQFRRGQGIGASVPSERVTRMLAGQGVGGDEGQMTIAPSNGGMRDLPAAVEGASPPPTAPETP